LHFFGCAEKRSIKAKPQPTLNFSLSTHGLPRPEIMSQNEGVGAAGGSASVATSVKERGSRRPALGKILPKYMAPKEYVTAYCRYGQQQSPNRWPAQIMEEADDGTFTVFFPDEAQNADRGLQPNTPAHWIRRLDLTVGRARAVIDAADMRGEAVRRAPRAPKRRNDAHRAWRLDGIFSAHLAPALVAEAGQPPVPLNGAMADRLIFNASMSYHINGQWVENTVPEPVSLRELVNEQPTPHDADMFAVALFDFLDDCYHTTPSQTDREEWLGSVEVDRTPQEQAKLQRARQEIYATHAAL
jgi:hypothetical protein